MSKSSDGLSVTEILEMREKAIEQEKKLQSNKAIARSKPAASALPGGGKNQQGKGAAEDSINGEYRQNLASYWENEFNHQSRTKITETADSSTTSPGEEDLDSGVNEDDDSKAKERERKRERKRKIERKRERVLSKIAETDASTSPGEDHHDPGASDEKDSKAKGRVGVPASPSPEIPASLPGAYAHQGIGVDADDSSRRDSDVEEVCDANLVSASRVNDAEKVFEAEDIKHDYHRRNMMLIACACILVVVVIAIVLNKYLQPDDDDDDCTGDELCCQSVAQQPLAVRCYCSNFTTTGNFYDAMDERGQQEYRRLTRNTTQEFSNDTDSCDLFNQYALIVSNLTTSEDAGGSFAEAPSSLNLTLFTLIDIYLTMDGIHWLNSEDWLSEEVCSYFGLSCGFIDVVVTLRMPDNGLEGTLPTYLGCLQSLRDLDLSENEDIEGPIPSELGNMTNLQSVILMELSLTGTIPTQVGSLQKLDELFLDNNDLTGTLPSELFNLPHLRSLSLANNGLNGTLPPEIKNSTRLTSLNLGGNQLSGNLTSLRGLRSLELLKINNNTFEGEIPSFLGTTTLLEFLFLQGSGLKGTIPETFCNFTKRRKAYKVVIDCEVDTTHQTLQTLCTCCGNRSQVDIECYHESPWVEGGH
jgi:hypothetical protein